MKENAHHFKKYKFYRSKYIRKPSVHCLYVSEVPVPVSFTINAIVPTFRTKHLKDSKKT